MLIALIIILIIDKKSDLSSAKRKKLSYSKGRNKIRLGKPSAQFLVVGIKGAVAAFGSLPSRLIALDHGIQESH